MFKINIKIDPNIGPKITLTNTILQAETGYFADNLTSKHFEANFGYQNSAYAYSQPHLSTLSVTKFVSPEEKYLKRSASSASQFVSASRLSGLNEMSQHPQHPQVQLSASQLTGYQRNEFDTSKFTTGLAFRTQSQYDLPSFGLDPDEPIFVTGPYGKGGLQPDFRPFSALSGARAPPSWRPRSANGVDNSLQWYRPRSLVNLEDDTSSIWSGVGNRPQDFTQVKYFDTSESEQNRRF